MRALNSVHRFSNVSPTMATVVVAVLLPLLCFDVVFSAVALNDAPNNLNSAFYNDIRQLLQLGSNLYQKNVNKRNYGGESTFKPDVPRAVKQWPNTDLNLGQVSGVSVNSNLQPVIFHRADRIWDEHTFNLTNHYQQTHLGPIREPTVLTLDPKTGRILQKWGENMFYMPHGLTIDKHDNLWITDVALHQVFKFHPGKSEPVLTFGQAFQPGVGVRHLCKPTSVAVASTGEIFIADGYCNSRILKFNAAGGLLRVIPNPPEFLSLLVPHALALIESMDRICVADRENMRVTCPRAGLYNNNGDGDQALTIQQPDMGRVFGVTALGSIVYAVNGPTSSLLPVHGLTIDPQAESVIDHWAPEEGFGNPHAIAACPNGSALYVAEIAPNRIWKFELVPPKK